MYGTYGLDTDDRPITNDIKLQPGQKIKFIYPEHSIDVYNTKKYLILNKIYTVQSIKYIHPYFNEMMIKMEEIKEDINFNSRQFILDLKYNVSIFSKKYIKYCYQRLKIKLNKLFHKGYDTL